MTILIRQLVAYDHDKVMDLVGKKPAENLFIIGDIEAYGYDSDFQRLFGEFKEDQLIAILLDYDHNYIVYSEQAYDMEGFAKIINADEQLTGFSGLREIVSPMEHLIKKVPKRKSDTYYAKCESLAVKSEQQFNIVKTTIEDIPAHIDLLRSIPEFKGSPTNAEQMKRAIDNKTGRSFAIWDGDDMVSVVSTTAENKQSAMIIGVGTRQAFKRQGFASELMIKTCEELLAEGKTLCLFYDNPQAGKIYERLGFEKIGMWNMNNY